jgi:hypothetical protein
MASESKSKIYGISAARVYASSWIQSFLSELIFESEHAKNAKIVQKKNHAGNLFGTKEIIMDVKYGTILYGITFFEATDILECKDITAIKATMDSKVLKITKGIMQCCGSEFFFYPAPT